MNADLPVQQRTQQMAVRQDPLSTIAQLKQRREQIQTLLKELMKKGVHYDKAPGTDSDRKTLLKPGVELILSTFMLRPLMQIKQIDLPGSHREYRCDVEILSSAGEVVSSGVGSCSTMESKYRWRYQERACPDCGIAAIKKAKPEPGRNKGGFYCWKKLGGCGATFGPQEGRITRQEAGKVENPDIADQYNTVLKMAAKRALTHATLLATAASDMFETEEEEAEDGPRHSEEPEEAPPPKQDPRQVLLRQVKAASDALIKDGKEREFLDQIIESLGIPKREKLGEFTDHELKAMLKAFQEAIA